MKRTLKMLCISMAVIFSLSIFAYATSQTKDIEVLFNDIKILINKENFSAKDVNGNNVEPFIYNGTTYLPVRAIANAFDKNVDWKPETSTVVLESKKEVFLDSLSYISRFEYPAELTYIKAGRTFGSTETDNHCIEIGYWDYEGNQISSEIDEFKQKIVYDVKKYEKFETILSGYKSKLNIYGDDKLIYNTPILGEGSNINISIDISDYSTLCFEYTTKKEWYTPILDDYNDHKGDLILNEAKFIQK